jgi:hypothetical protein
LQVRVTRRLLRYGLRCIAVAEFFGEARDMYLHFAEVFTTLDGGRWGCRGTLRFAAGAHRFAAGALVEAPPFPPRLKLAA